MDFDLIGIDLDGTLLDAHGRVSPRNVEAIRAAQQAGATIVPCTGRGWREARKQLDAIPGLSLGVYVTGAILADVATGQTLHHTPMDAQVVTELIDLLRDQPHAVLVFREPERAGHEYLVTGDGKLSTNSAWWFNHTEARVHHLPRPSADQLNDCVRVGMIAPEDEMPAIDARVHQRFADTLEYHSFAAIPMPDDPRMLHILEVFSKGVTKWSGIEWIARQKGIPTGRVAVIGDQINDVPALAAAGCGIAMANAVEPAKSAARFITRSNTDHGVAHAIEQLLANQWK